VAGEFDRDDEDKIIPSNMPHKTRRSNNSLDHVVKYLRDDADNTIALVISVTIVVLLEMVEIRITDRESFAAPKPPGHFAFDFDRAWKTSGWMHQRVSIRPRHHRSQPEAHFG